VDRFRFVAEVAEAEEFGDGGVKIPLLVAMLERALVCRRALMAVVQRASDL
jgi:hypothetical protein